MFSEISWSQYFTVLIIATLLYYLFVCMIVYRGKLSFFASFTRAGGHHQAEDGPDELMTTTQHVIDELRPLFAGKPANRKCFLVSSNIYLNIKIGRKQDLKTPLIPFILGSFQTTCSINDANTKVRSYFRSGTNLMYAIGAILCLIGTVKAYASEKKKNQVSPCGSTSARTREPQRPTKKMLPTTGIFESTV